MRMTVDAEYRATFDTAPQRASPSPRNNRMTPSGFLPLLNGPLNLAFGVNIHSVVSRPDNVSSLTQSRPHPRAA